MAKKLNFEAHPKEQEMKGAGVETFAIPGPEATKSRVMEGELVPKEDVRAKMGRAALKERYRILSEDLEAAKARKIKIGKGALLSLRMRNFEFYRDERLDERKAA